MKHRAKSVSAGRASMAIVGAACLLGAGAVQPQVAETVTAEWKPLATVTPASSTSQIFASPVYYGRNFTDTYGDQVVAPFFVGPTGIVTSVRSHDDEKNVVLSSGWSATNAAAALRRMEETGDPALQSVKLWIMDNSTSAPNGGFWTMYGAIAPLFGASPDPVPSDTTAPVVVTQYQYNINSNAPQVLLNPFSMANAWIAYVFDYGSNTRAPMPDEALDPVQAGDQHFYYVVKEDGTYVKTPVDGNVTYVMFTKERLPLLRPLELLPFGKVLADALRPLVTKLVEAGYPNGTSVPTDPTKVERATLFSVTHDNELMTVNDKRDVSRLIVDQDSDAAQEEEPTDIPLDTDTTVEAEHEKVVVEDEDNLPAEESQESNSEESEAETTEPEDDIKTAPRGQKERTLTNRPSISIGRHADKAESDGDASGGPSANTEQSSGSTGQES